MQLYSVDLSYKKCQVFEDGKLRVKYSMQMFFSQTDYEGQIKTLTQYIDPKTDGIIVAGGDGTLLEVRSKILYLTYQISC